MPSSEDIDALRGVLENRRAEVVALRRLIIRAADRLEKLTENDCPEPVAHKVKEEAEILRKIATDETDQIGDVSTLADPSVVENLIANR